tara:strand:- start:771 stop:3137 length:2367 start_codon:yes stop_codon:yes gene_type:complete
MQTYNNSVVLKFDDSATGNADSGAPVTVRIASSGALATIYNNQEVQILNPLSTDSSGNYSFKAADGLYNIVIREGQANELTLSGIALSDVTPPVELSLILARMAAGVAVKIACFGDSTTDGNQTTGWSANPKNGNGTAIGTRDQNLFALNAWPAKLELILQDVFDVTNITTWNAGYSGQRMDNGWAVANYQAAVINTYGIPDIVFIGFGLNDIQDAGSQIDAHVEQTEILLNRVISEGTTPVLLTNDAEYRNGTFGSVRDHKESNRQINEAKKSLALKYNIQIIDMNLGLKNWIQNNSDGYRWSEQQADGLHFSDKGHLLKASLITSIFSVDTIPFNGGDISKNIDSWDSSTAYVGNYSTLYTLSNNRQGGNVLYSSSAPASTDMMDMLVWNESPNAYITYLGIDNDFSSSGAAPSVSVKSYIDETLISKDLISAGGFNSLARRSDEQFTFGKLSYGLNRIKYTSGGSPTLFYGGWKISEANFSSVENVLCGSGRFRRGYSANTGLYVDPVGIMPAMQNTVGGFDGDTVSISVDAVLPPESGVLLLVGQGFDGTQSAVTNNRKSGVILFRRSNDEAGIYNVSFDDLGAVAFVITPILSTTPLDWSDNKFVGRVEISRVANTQNYKVFNKYRGGATVGDVNVALVNSTRWSGFVGGVFYNSDTAGVNASVEVLRMQINRDYEAAKIDPDIEDIGATNTVIPQTGGGTLTALRTNEIRDSGAYTLPLANAVLVNQTIIITLPSRYGASTPTVTRSGSDTITNIDGTDTSITFAGSAKLSLTSDGVSNWSL